MFFFDSTLPAVTADGAKLRSPLHAPCSAAERQAAKGSAKHGAGGRSGGRAAEGQGDALNIGVCLWQSLHCVALRCAARHGEARPASFHARLGETAPRSPEQTLVAPQPPALLASTEKSLPAGFVRVCVCVRTNLYMGGQGQSLLPCLRLHLLLPMWRLFKEFISFPPKPHTHTQSHVHTHTH